MIGEKLLPVDDTSKIRRPGKLQPHPPLRLELSLRDAHGICNGKKIPWEGELNLRFDP